MTTITIKTNLLRRIAPYILFLFTVLSFFFTTSFLLYLFISLAVVGFIFVNTTQLFLRERYLSFIEIFSSILLLVRLILIYSQGLFYVIIIGFILLNLVIFYILNFSNYKTENTNILGIKREREYIARKRVQEDNFNDELDEDGLEEEDQDQLEEDVFDENIENENTDNDLDQSESIDDQLDADLFEEEVKPTEKKEKKLISSKSKKINTKKTKKSI